MATTVLVWNIQEFGTRTIGAETIRCQAIAKMAADAEADVLIIQELQRRGVDSLPTLRDELNEVYGAADWHFDWVMGAIVNMPAAGDVGRGDLGFCVGANTEGYAVLYRGAVLARVDQTLSAGQDQGLGDDMDDADPAPPPPHYLGLGIGGLRPVAPDPQPAGRPPIAFGADHVGVVGFTNGGTKRVRRVGARAMPRRGAFDPLGEVLFNTLTRRPCYVVLAADGAGRPDYTIVAYHAPAKMYGNYYGTVMGFAIDALQGGHCAYAGDYNLIGSPLRQVVRNMANDRGFDQTTLGANGDSRSTMVHASQNDAWRQGGNVLTNCRDFGFGKTAACQMNVYDDFLDFDGNHLQDYIEENRDEIIGLLGEGFVGRLPGHAADILNEYFDGTHAYPPGADNGTARALIYYLLFSDHLPIRIVVG